MHELLEALEAMLALHQRMMDEANHAKSAWQAETIRQMNEVPGKARELVEKYSGGVEDTERIQMGEYIKRKYPKAFGDET